MHRPFLICAATCLAAVCSAQDMRVPASVVAGDNAIISTTGSGKATFYLLGPGVSTKSQIDLGDEVRLRSQDLQNAGKYVAALCSERCRTEDFYVISAKPASLTFLVHPSRVRVDSIDAISGVALPFDQFHNLVLVPETINIQLRAGNSSLFDRPARTQDGIAWFRTASEKSAGTLQVVASLNDLSARRAVQQVASDPCNLRIKGQRTKAGILVQTDPVRDCAGNPVPDGTIVTFTATDANGTGTVDAPIKKGVAEAVVEASSTAIISVASGVAIGNELRMGAQP